MEIRSYRRVFDLERRIYRIDSLRLNPGGVPVRGIVYFLVALLASMIAGSLPGPRELLGVLPWYLRDLALPGLTALLLGVIRIDGRPFHLAARAALRHRLGPRSLVALRSARALDGSWSPDEVTLLPDGSDAEVRALRYSGPGAMRIAGAYPRPVFIELRSRARLRGRARTLTLNDPAHAGGRSARVVVLERGARATLLLRKGRGR